MNKSVLLVTVLALMVLTQVMLPAQAQTVNQPRIEFGCIASGKGAVLWNAMVGSEMHPDWWAPTIGVLKFSGVAAEATVVGGGGSYFSQTIKGTGNLVAGWIGPNHRLNWMAIAIRSKQGTIGFFQDPAGFLLGSGEWVPPSIMGENLLFSGYLNGKWISGECFLLAYPVGDDPPAGFKAALVQLLPREGPPVVIGWFNMPLPLPPPLAGSTPTGNIQYSVKIETP